MAYGLVAVRQSPHPRHDTQHIVVNGIHADLGGGVVDGRGSEGEGEGSVINAREIASARWLMLLGFEAEGVHVDTDGGHILVVLIGLNEVEVTAVPF